MGGTYPRPSSHDSVLSPQARPPDPPPGRGGAGGILQGAGCHCFRQVPPTGSSPAPPPTPGRTRLSREHDGRGDSCSHLCPELPPLPPGTAAATLRPGQGPGCLLCVRPGASAPVEAWASAPRSPQGDLASLATPGWTSGSGSPRHQSPGTRGSLPGGTVSPRGSWVTARGVSEPRRS